MSRHRPPDSDLVIVVRVLLAAISAAVLALTGIAWVTAPDPPVIEQEARP